MKVAIDYQTALGEKTGFGFYVKNLVENLENIDKGNQYIRLSPKTEKILQLSIDSIGTK